MKLKYIQIWDRARRSWRDKILQDDEVDDFEENAILLTKNFFDIEHERALWCIGQYKTIIKQGYMKIPERITN